MALKPREAELVNLFPQILWHAGMSVATRNATGVACRFCIALHGLKAEDISMLPKTAAEHAEHIKREHMAGNAR